MVRNEVDMATLADWLAEKPFTLTMSSGFFGFFAHAGMLLALEERGLIPARITGASAGALVGSARASGLSARATLGALLALNRDDFWDPAIGLGLLRGARFRTHLANILPVASFEECALPFSVSVHEWATHSTRVISSGALAPAVYASCAVPLLFQPQRLDGKLCADGGIADRWGLAATRPGERVFYHHIGSRSPWRRAGSPSLLIPARPNLAALELFDVPRSGPTRLARGADIAKLAHNVTGHALNSALGTRESRFRTLGSSEVHLHRFSMQ
jgi:NTE family protein